MNLVGNKDYYPSHFHMTLQAETQGTGVVRILTFCGILSAPAAPEYL